MPRTPSSPDSDAIQWPGWDDLTPEAKARLRQTLESTASRKANNPALKAAAYRVLYEALVESERVMSQFATESEKQRRDHLFQSLRDASLGEAHHLHEELSILERGITLRSQLKQAEGDSSEVRANLVVNHERWVRQMRAIRSSLDSNELSRATFSISDGRVFVSLQTHDSTYVSERRNAVARSLAHRLQGDDRLRVSFSTHYPIFIPSDAESD